MANSLVLSRPAESLQNGAGFNGKTGIIYACQQGKGDLRTTKRAVGKDARAALAKRKRNTAICPDQQTMKWERVKVSESHTLTRERGREREGKSNLCNEGKGVSKRERVQAKKSP